MKFLISGTVAWTFELIIGHYLEFLKISKQTSELSYAQLTRSVGHTDCSRAARSLASLPSPAVSALLHRIFALQPGADWLLSLFTPLACISLFSAT